MPETKPVPSVDWASTPDGSYFYAANVLDYGHVYGRLTWTEPGRAAVTIWSPLRWEIYGYLDVTIMTRIITPQEFEAAKELNFPPVADVMRFLGHDTQPNGAYSIGHMTLRLPGEIEAEMAELVDRASKLICYHAGGTVTGETKLGDVMALTVEPSGKPLGELTWPEMQAAYDHLAVRAMALNASYVSALADTDQRTVVIDKTAV